MLTKMIFINDINIATPKEFLSEEYKQGLVMPVMNGETNIIGMFGSEVLNLNIQDKYYVQATAIKFSTAISRLTPCNRPKSPLLRETLFYGNIDIFKKDQKPSSNGLIGEHLNSQIRFGTQDRFIDSEGKGLLNLIYPDENFNHFEAIIKGIKFQIEEAKQQEKTRLEFLNSRYGQ